MARLAAAAAPVMKARRSCAFESRSRAAEGLAPRQTTKTSAEETGPVMADTHGRVGPLAILFGAAVRQP
jgi:hypothetical protein